MKRFAFSIVLILLTGCGLTLQTSRTEIVPPPGPVKRVYVSIQDESLDGGTQAYVNASMFAAVKAGSPNAVLVAGGDDLEITAQMLSAIFQPRWYTLLTLGFLKEYYQLGSVRVVHAGTGKILAIHSLTLKGRRILPLQLEDYQTLVIPQLVKLIQDELRTNGLAGNRTLTLILPDA